jgi:carbon starvation protein
LMEGFVAIMALIAATSLIPHDYFTINVKPESLHLLPVWAASGGQLEQLTRMVGEERLAGRPGGAVSLAVGMAQIFSGIPGLRSLMAYWYHFAIMFEALFILTAVDTGTRVARFIVHEFLHVRRGAAHLGTASYPSIIITGAAASVCWGYLLYNNDIMSIWPMFGIANQLLAAIALAIGTSYVLRVSRPRYALATALPMVFVLVTTMWAGWLNIRNNYLPAHSYLNAVLTAAMMLMAVAITVLAAASWARVLARVPAPVEAAVEESVGAER